MKRPWTYTLALVLNVLYCLLALQGEIENLTLGAAASEAQYGGDGPPFFLTLIQFAIAIIGLAASYGVWKMQKWGIVVVIAVTAMNILPQLGAMLFTPFPVNLFAGFRVVWSIAIIALLLWPKPKRVPLANVAS